MSNFKKILALALAAVMIVGMMVFAPAASAYEPTGEYKDSIALLNAFDVMLGDGVSFGEKEEVTRWQMALFIARIVTGETGNAMWEGEKSEYFTDVTAENYPGAIDFCAELGIIKGVGDNKYEPEAPILYQDALTMIVRLLGRETKTTTYPWGYILESRNISYDPTPDNTQDVDNDIYLTEKIDTGYKKNLLREEVAELLSKMIYVPVLDAAGKESRPLIESGLKCVDLGTYSLFATSTAALGDTELAKYGEATFVGAEGPVTVKVANITKGALDLNNYLGFTAKLAKVKKTIIAKMNPVVVYDTGEFTVENATITIKETEKTFRNVGVYGTSEKAVFVSAKAEDLNPNGRVYVCGDAARFVPYTSVKALYPVTVSVKKTDKWPADTTLTLYYKAANDEYRVASDNKVVGIAGKPDDGIAKGTTVTTNAKIEPTLASSTSLNTAVDGAVIWGEPFLGNITVVGNVSFITVASYPDIVTGTAKFNGTGDKTVKLSDTEFNVGYAATGSAVNGWYTSFDDSASFISLAGSDVDYMTVGGYLVSMKKHDGTTTPTDKKPNEYTKTPIVLVINKDGTNVTVNADDTITVPTLNLATGAVENIKVDQVNGTRIGRLINLFGLQLFDAENAGEVLLSLLDNEDTVHTTLKNGTKDAYSILATVANKTDDVYSVSGAVDKYVQARLNAATELTFKKYATVAISTGTYTQLVYDADTSTATEAKYKNAAAKYLTVSADTEILVIAKDTMGTIKGAVPANGSFLKLYSDETSQFIFELSNNRIVIYNAEKTFAEITNITKSTAPVAVEGDWYTLTWTTSYVGMEIVKNGDKTCYNYIFKNMYNLTSKTLEDVTISCDAYYPNPAAAIFGAKWAGDKTAADKQAAAAGNTKSLYDVWFISNETGSGAQKSTIISWGLAHGYELGKLTNIAANDPNTLVIENLACIAEAGTQYTIIDGDAAKDVDIVVGYKAFVLNQTTTSNADELLFLDHTFSNTDVFSQMLANSNVSGSPAEFVMYKVSDSGIADILINLADSIAYSEATTVIDTQAK